MSWKARLQDTIALSTTKVEFIVNLFRSVTTRKNSDIVANRRLWFFLSLWRSFPH
jgi:hypothetical protein